MSNLKDVKPTTNTVVLRDGKQRTIRYDLNAMAEMEDRYGSVDKAFEALDSNSIKAVRFMLWAGLIHEDPDLTEKQVGGLIDMQYLGDLMQRLGVALDSDLPVQQENSTLEGNQ